MITRFEMPQRCQGREKRSLLPPLPEIAGAVLILFVAFALLVLARPSSAAENEEQTDEARREVQLRKMKLSAAQYTIAAAAAPEKPFKFVEAPLLRWTNPVGGAKDGTVFLWTDRGRPQAVLQLFTYDDDHFSHEWQSMAEVSLTAERRAAVAWNPKEPGIRFRELNDADAPSTMAAGRLRQMKSLSSRFTVTFTGFAQSPTPVELRLLPQPLYRYDLSRSGDGDDEPLFDGALFAFVQGTDPQALLALEARRDGGNRRWHFAFARMASGAVTARDGDREVFSVAKYDFSQNPQEPFLLLPRQPVPDKNDN